MQHVRPSAPGLADLIPYDPKYLPARIYLNANESPYGLPASVVKELANCVSGQVFHRYPDPLARKLREEIAEKYGLSPAHVLLGNGGDELLFDILLAYGGEGRKLLTAPPSFSSYELDAKLTDTQIVEIPRGCPSVILSEAKDPAEDIRPEPAVAAPPPSPYALDEQAILARVSQGDIDVVMLASPNNPTGDVMSEEFIVALLNASDAVVLIDQAYVEFAAERYDVTGLLAEHRNLVLLRTFSKAYALAGIRLGYLLAAGEVVSELCKVRQPYSVDAFSALAGSAVLAAPDGFAKQVAESKRERERIFAALAALPGVEPYPSEANFILFRCPAAHTVWQRLYDEQGILLRDFSAAPGLTGCLRVSMGTPEENDGFLSAFTALIGETA
jgi:histidinol-phosphate aminotransferase